MDQYRQPKNSIAAATIPLVDNRPDLLLNRINQLSETIEYQSRQIKRLEREISSVVSSLRSSQDD